MEQLLATVPAEEGLAFVVVQHLSRDFRTLMDELLVGVDLVRATTAGMRAASASREP